PLVTTPHRTQTGNIGCKSHAAHRERARQRSSAFALERIGPRIRAHSTNVAKRCYVPLQSANSAVSPIRRLASPRAPCPPRLRRDNSSNSYSLLPNPYFKQRFMPLRSLKQPPSFVRITTFLIVENCFSVASISAVMYSLVRSPASETVRQNFSVA